MFTLAWLLWLGAFLIIEGFAIYARRRGDTLSEHTWDWFCLRRREKGTSCYLRRLAFLSFWAWLTIHFLSGGRWL